MSVVDSAMTREVLRDISKRPLDISRLNVHVMRGVVHLTGRVDKVRGNAGFLDLQEEMNIVVRILRQKPGVRDVCCEVDFAELPVPDKLTKIRKRRRWY
ncbi:MAG: BON domain-containing protein [Armatimonadetes bacterium]|nr:BON domain-containing protein [Armatimonadota bacterium]